MDKINKTDPDEVSIKELIIKFKSAIRYVKGRWLILLIFCICGALIGLFYSIVVKPKYIAVSTFVLEENGKGGSLGLGQYSNLASLAGIDIGSGSEKGLFQGDNIMELYKSRLMIEKTFLTPADIDGKKQMLIDRYISSSDFNSSWTKTDDMQSLNFHGNPKKFSRRQDSLLFDIIKYFNKHVLTIVKPDKKLSIISVEVKCSDELFAQLFDQNLVQNVNNFYVETQTKKALQNVRILQHQADSIRATLNNSIGKVAASTDATPNPNPTLKSLLVPYQKKQIDVQSNGAIYTEIVKNLELAKVSLRQETPLIQLIDEPMLPLDTEKIKKIPGMLIGLVSGFFLGVLYIAFSRFYIFIKNT